MTNQRIREEAIDVIVRRALEEDVGDGDVTSLATVGATAVTSGRFVAKEGGVLSGTGPGSRAFKLVDPSISVHWSRKDGDVVTAGEHIGLVTGNARAILTAERTALNLLQRMSGIATMTARMVAEAKPFGARILDTRKTAPGLRILDKAAVADGGGVNHRFGLHDMILIKDNHIVASGSTRSALDAATEFRNRFASKKLLIEIEARSLVEVREIAAYQEEYGAPDRILLDNMVRRDPDGRIDTSMLREAVALIAGRIETEASGNVELATVEAIAATGVDFISSGALTHSVSALDISLELSLDSGC